MKLQISAHTLAVAGQSFVLNAFSSNYGSLFITFEPFHERRAAELADEAIVLWPTIGDGCTGVVVRVFEKLGKQIGLGVHFVGPRHFPPEQ